MITVHHLENSRSHRVLWLLEELSVPYQIKRYQREDTLLAPDSLKKIHPLGKSPVITDGNRVIAESGAILEYLQQKYDSEHLFAITDEDEQIQARYWLHYAEGSLMPLLVMKLVFGQLGKKPVPWILRPAGVALSKGIQKAWLNKQLKLHGGVIEQHLSQHRYFAGSRFSIADVQMSFPLLALQVRGSLQEMPATARWLESMQQRAAWQRAIEQGGEITFS
ncbi:MULTISPECIES: glutathione S-transferase family protein [unclassified Pantoea]|uniref:glutathione S-transferase family protein n=1 Tax=unclassified Pantoea TaxID=2630326 RepID=UPI001CD27B74|nr:MULTISPECIES: glutathione S-transferase [unclassified Pantoea]MCA1176786.1 glutathione S-transferase [Pantoea sp. alder69]MCA1251238.1 glutathione S-transferase [Pantoea sp. alder70]MCA1265613.1 glutathione S-transferase [Pantoea sp. alder81]